MNPVTKDLSQAELARRRLRLGSTLREYRVERQLSGEELARQVEISQSKVSRIETGRIAPTPRDIRKIAKALAIDVPQVEELVAEAEAIADHIRSLRRERARIGLAGLQDSHLLSESLYTKFRDLSVGVLPAWVQTPDYARSLFRSIIPAPSVTEDVEGAVAKRIARQAILRDTSRTFDLITTPDTLRAHVCDTEEMYVQLVHLRSLMRLPNVTFRVLDLKHPLQTPLLTSFTVFEDKRVVIELLHTEIYVADPTEISDYLARFEALAACALDETASAEFIDEEVAKLR